MENRFGVKDFVLFILFGVLIVMVALAMKQYDRQWDEIQQIRLVVRDVQGKLANGVVVAGGGGGSNGTTTTTSRPNTMNTTPSSGRRGARTRTSRRTRTSPCR